MIYIVSQYRRGRTATLSVLVSLTTRPAVPIASTTMMISSVPMTRTLARPDDDPCAREHYPQATCKEPLSKPVVLTFLICDPTAILPATGLLTSR
jgi:hypothetical protein